MSSVKTDVNPSDIGTKALGRERFHRLRSMLSIGRAHLASGTVATSDSTSHWIRVWWIGRVKWSTHVSKSRFLETFSMQRGTPRESDTASRREEACLLNPCDVVAQ